MSASIVFLPTCRKSFDFAYGIFFFCKKVLQFYLVKCISLFFYGLWVWHSQLQGLDDIHWRCDLVLF